MSAGASAIGRWQGIVLALLGASAVATGAFGAHALRGMLPESAMQVWRTAVQYHFWHTLAFAFAAMLSGRRGTVAAVLFAIGVLLFSGSLYALALGAPRWMGIVTPVGGVAFILGWIALGVAVMRLESKSD